MSHHDQSFGDAISISMTGSRGVFVLPGRPEAEFKRKSKFDQTISNQPDWWRFEYELKIDVFESGQDTIDELQNRIFGINNNGDTTGMSTLQDYYVLADRSMIFKSASLVFDEEREYAFDSDTDVITVTPTTDIYADITSSIRNLLSLSGDPFCNTDGGSGLTTGMSRAGSVGGGSFAIYTGSTSTLTSSEGSVQSFKGIGQYGQFYFTTTFPFRTDYDAPLVFSFYVADSGSGGFDAETFIRLLDSGSNVIVADTQSFTIAEDGQERIVHRSLFRGIDTDVINIQTGIITVSSMSADYDMFQFEVGKVRDPVNR